MAILLGFLIDVDISSELPTSLLIEREGLSCLLWRVCLAILLVFLIDVDLSNELPTSLLIEREGLSYFI